MGDVLRLLFGLRLVATAHLVLMLCLGHAGVGRGLGQPPRAEIVSEVAGGDLDDVALAAQLVDVLKQDRLCSSLCHPILNVRAAWPPSMVAWLEGVRQPYEFESLAVSEKTGDGVRRRW